MYSGPDTSKDVVSQALLGQVVGIVEEKDGFVRIETPDRYRGWVPVAALFPYPDPAAPRYARRGPVADVTALMANLYRDPSVTRARPKARAPLGTRLEVNASAVLPTGADAGRWIAVRLPNGEGAYVQRGDVRIGDAAAARVPGSGSDLVATARRFLGVPYLWGGMSFHGVDCSGLVSRVYAVNGIDLLRDADIQFTDPRGAGGRAQRAAGGRPPVLRDEEDHPRRHVRRRGALHLRHDVPDAGRARGFPRRSVLGGPFPRRAAHARRDVRLIRPR